MSATLTAARNLFPADFLYGDPRYYERFGFTDASRWGVTTAEGNNFPDFMGTELRPDGLFGLSGRLVESGLFEVDQAAVDDFDQRFPPCAKAVKQARP